MSFSELLSTIQTLRHADKIRLMDFLVSQIASEEGISLIDGRPTNCESIDALQHLSNMALPMGPEDLARNFDRYTGKVLSDESAQ